MDILKFSVYWLWNWIYKRQITTLGDDDCIDKFSIFWRYRIFFILLYTQCFIITNRWSL